MYAQTININDNQAYVLNIPWLKTSLTHALIKKCVLIIEVHLLTRVYGMSRLGMSIICLKI